MKIHLAYDDGTLIGVYRKRKDAKRALSDKAREISGGYFAPSKWSECSDGIDRIVTTGRMTWEQWIDTYEVTK